MLLKSLQMAVSKSGTGTRGQGTWGRWDSGTRRHILEVIEFQKWESIPKKVELLTVFTQISAALE